MSKHEMCGPVRHIVIDGEIIEERELITHTVRKLLANRSQRFLKGPIPLHHLAAAWKLGGAALPLLLLVHHEHAMNGAGKLPKHLLEEFGIDRSAKCRGLHALEQAGLVRLRQERGRPARVVLVCGAPRAIQGRGK